MSGHDVLKTIKDKEIKYVDFRFCDTRGKEQHVTVPSHTIEEELFTDGKMFDGSSIAGWKGINESDMILLPDASTAFVDPFFDDPTLVISCDVIEPRSEEHTSELQSLMRLSYAVFCLTKKKENTQPYDTKYV